MSGYTPLFPEIVSSSIWNEDPATCKVWVTMLALADAEGNLYGSAAGFAPLARVSIDSCKTAIAILTSPDGESRSPEHEGRRLLPIEGGWHIANHKKYRDKAKSRADYYRNWRATKTKEISPTPPKENTHTQTVKHAETACNTAQQGETVAPKAVSLPVATQTQICSLEQQDSLVESAPPAKLPMTPEQRKEYFEKARLGAEARQKQKKIAYETVVAKRREIELAGVAKSDGLKIWEQQNSLVGSAPAAKSKTRLTA